MVKQKKGVSALGVPVYLVLLVLVASTVSLVGCSVGAGAERPSPSRRTAMPSVSTPTSASTSIPEATLTPTTDAKPTPEVSPSPTASAEEGPTDVPSDPVGSQASAPLPCPYLTGRTEIGVLESQKISERVRYLVHLPPCYDQYPDKAFPVLYLLHGWPLDEWHWMDLGVDALSDDWISRGLVGPFIVVLPGADSNGHYVNSSGGADSFEGFVVDELVPHIDRSYRTWATPEGRAIGGISRGGVWALEIAFRHPGLFGAVGGHSPALALNRPLPQYDPYLLAQSGLASVRIYLDAGDADWARAGAIKLRDLLIEAGVDVVYQVHEGGHVDSLWRGGLPDYLEFYTATWPPRYDGLPRWEDVSRGAVSIP